jgi:hypothetical protein
MSKYVITISEDTLDLIEALNNGVRPEIEERTTCFIFDTKSHNDIKFEDDLYDENEHSATDLHWMIG